MTKAIPKICMVGSSMVDLVARVPQLPKAGETLTGSEFAIGFGGKGSNQAVMAARLGAQVSVLVKLGRDVFGENTLQNYRDHDIDVTHVMFDDERFSGVAPIAVEDATGQNSIIVVPGANEGLSIEDVRQAAPAIAEADVLICQLEIPIQSTLEAFRLAKQGAATTILNPAPALPLPDDLLRLTDILVPNEVEAAMMVGTPISSLEEGLAAAQGFLERGPKIVVITMGERGAVFAEVGTAPQHVPIEAVQAVDTTGAGDAFVGSLAYFVALGLTLEDAISRSCAIASRSVLKRGTQTSFPYASEVSDLLVGV